MSQTIATQHLIDKLEPMEVGSNLPEELTGICSPQNPKRGHVVFCRNVEECEQAASSDTPPALIVTGETDWSGEIPKIIVKNPAMAFITALRDFFEYRMDESGIAESASVDPSAKIGENVTVSANCVIGKGAKIGSGSRLASGVIIEDHAELGEQCYLHSGVVIRHHCVLGDRVQIHANTTIGSDGYGYTPSPKGAVKIPQVGNVVIENDVEIGANCAIDRATLDSTIIGAGTKLDNLIHVAHNCTFGENCFITAGYMTGGSTKVGNQVTTGGHVTVNDHIEIADNVTIAGYACVTNSLKKPGAYGGYPARPMKEFLKIQASQAFLPGLLSKVRRLIKGS